ncbi:MAG TPA: hypothetical protein VM076_11925 [Gemmatimonadaceae bacterium]|nr:hypothetical protein [Gemmatimonadaceae bacterium]
MAHASPVLISSFVGLALVVAFMFVFAVKFSAPGSTRAVAVATILWLAATMALAAGGKLSFISRPPTMMLAIAASIALAIAIGTSRLGLRIATGVPIAALVGAQAFRFPLELLLHRSYSEGLMPVQMSFEGLNYDILSGLSAIVVALVLVRRPRSLAIVRAWNVVGTLLLANILTVALLSAPTPFRVFRNEPANVWIAQAPWVWLPAVFVLAAILGHILVFRRLRAEAAVAAVSPVAQTLSFRA